MAAPRLELDVRADDQVLDGAGDEDLAGRGERADPRPDIDGDAGDVLTADLALSGVQTRPHVDPQLPHRARDRARGLDPARRTVECRQEAVARGLHHAPAIATELLPHD